MANEWRMKEHREYFPSFQHYNDERIEIEWHHDFDFRVLVFVISKTKTGLRSWVLVFEGLIYRSNRSFKTSPPGMPRAFDTFAVQGRREFDYQSFPGDREFDPPALGGGGKFELHPRVHMKSLARRAVMGDALLEDFRGKDCAFVANWLQGLCRIWRYLNFNIFSIGFRLWIYECRRMYSRIARIFFSTKT